ncbi:MAG: DNA polymerase III subunit epsilon [Proteobacteria bacterium]|nr:DNA polymerase III subunit epsilon [Pseudomonadota bacterium]
MRELCLDTETTGLDPRSGDRVIEIAVVEMVNKVKTGNVFHTYINPRREVPQEAFNIHGISTTFLKDKPVFDHIAQKFLDFLEGGTLVIHNAAFDLKFLNYELTLLGLPALDTTKVVDSLKIARQKFPGAPASLDALCRRFAIDLSKRTKHGALLDAELLCEVYIELMGGAQTGFGFDAAKIEAKRIELEKSASAKNKNILPKRDFPVSEDDLKLHQEFVTKHIKGNFWGY